ncbi:HAD family phosphatase [Pedobacter sp.]|jgi:FMN phosphatase YigB (HAD superfamily)|uniref:HAD family hydrolase n=1 Tax=Pedobacter sp. TaxID=1411316 RepID=UPI002C7DA65B|nr:HAD family phosphatase [Pedobacter sp.]HWW41263.1 HAD family phosphatase [Pedobacter sp.]
MQKIKNIIFDYGNVIFEINFKNAQFALEQLGISNVAGFFDHKSHNNIFDDFETGTLTPNQFRDGIRKEAGNNLISDEQIDAAWNSLLIGVPPGIHELLLKVKEKYRTFLLSNNNEIHYLWIMDYLKREFKMESIDHLFEKAYFSQQMYLRKPNVEIFEQVIRENNLVPAETLFIDDSPQHIEGAKKAGLNALLMTAHPQHLENFLQENHII